MKKAFMNASVASMIYKFNMNNIELLERLGYKVDVACNFGKENPISQEEVDDFKLTLKKRQIRYVNIPCPRSIFELNSMRKAYLRLKRIADKERYDLVHTQSPIGGVICRLAFRKSRRKYGTKVIYQAHGFHFYKGAPLKNWLIYYPVENICSYFTDVLITINTEDYELARKRFHAKRVEYVPGVGVDTGKFGSIRVDCKSKRREMAIPEDADLLLSVGELNENKNHETVIQALAKLREQNIYYIIAGTGDRREKLIDLTKELGLIDRVKFLGLRDDVGELCKISDIYVFPSFREGLSVSLMEAMASGLPCVVSRIRGNTDLIDEEGGALFDPHSVEECKTTIEKVLEADRKKMGVYNIEKIKSFDINRISSIMEEEYEKVIGGGTGI